MKKDKEEERLAKDWPCKKCGKKTIWFIKGETYDGSYDTYDYHCHSCGYRWDVVDEVD